MRRWRPRDLDPCAAMNADPLVMEHFSKPLSRSESARFIELQEQGFEQRGYGLWAVELPGEAELIGCVGLLPVESDVAFAPAVEVGWRLCAPFWGMGFATEAASAAISFGFDELELASLLAYTAERNLRSRRVMARLGMLRDPAEDFIHPAVPVGDPLAQHVLYRLDADTWGAENVSE
jgi:RimJ/RimL family protein N-acetyltransferase